MPANRRGKSNPPRRRNPNPSRPRKRNPPRFGLATGRVSLNVIPDRKDDRDLTLRQAGNELDVGLPASVDYSNQMSPVGDQKDTGSCVGWSVSYLRAWMERESGYKEEKFSARFIWMAAKEIDVFELNSMFELAGTRIRDAFKVMSKYGALPDEYWRFSRDFPRSSNEDELKRIALAYRIGRYFSLENIQDMRFHLAENGPFVAGVPVYSNWNRIDNSGIVPSPAGTEKGGHAVLVVGYDDTTRRFKFQNSWGRGWGDDGFGYFTYSYMSDFAFSSWGADRL